MKHELAASQAGRPQIAPVRSWRWVPSPNDSDFARLFRPVRVAAKPNANLFELFAGAKYFSANRNVDFLNISQLKYRFPNYHLSPFA